MPPCSHRKAPTLNEGSLTLYSASAPRSQAPQDCVDFPDGSEKQHQSRESGLQVDGVDERADERAE